MGSSIRNQEICRKLVNREVIYCVSYLVHELVQRFEAFPDYEDDLLGAFMGEPDYQEAAEAEGWKEAVNDEQDTVFLNETLEEWSEAEDWKELCEEQDVDVDEYRPEVLEHWIVSDFLANKLEEHGEKIMRDFFGMTVWGRSTSGQSIYMDQVIEDIASDMQILVGQERKWR